VQAGDTAYDPRVALEFFRGAGKPERIAAGATIFAEKEKGLFKRSRIYLKTSPSFTESMLSSLAERLRFLTSRIK